MSFISNLLTPKKNKINRNGTLVIGLGRFGGALAEELEACGDEVLALDKDPEVVQRMSSRLRNVIQADSTDEEVLHQFAAADFAHVVVAIGSDLSASILTTSLLLKIGCQSVWAKADSPEQGQIFKQLGVRNVFYPNSDMGRRAAHLVSQAFLDYVDLGYGFALVAMNPPKMLHGYLASDLDMLRKEGITIVAVRLLDGSWQPMTTSELTSDDTILVVLPIKKIHKIQQYFNHAGANVE